MKIYVYTVVTTEGGFTYQRKPEVFKESEIFDVQQLLFMNLDWEINKLKCDNDENFHWSVNETSFVITCMNELAEDVTCMGAITEFEI